MIKLPDILEIKPLWKPPHATITVPGSKSITNRALILAALADGKCTLRGALWADDTEVMVDSLQRLGFEVNVSPDPAEECNRTIEVVGRGGEIPLRNADLYVGNAGTAARFLTALVSLAPSGEYRIAGDARMHERPMKDLFKGLKEVGVDIDSTKDRLPAILRPNAYKMHNSRLVISTRLSTQFASALMLIAQHAKMTVELEEPDEPHGYIEMTKRMIDEFRRDYLIEPDLSGASYFVAAQFLTGGKVTVAGWPVDSMQLDGGFPRYLPPPRSISRARDLGDSVMTLVICALFGDDPMDLVEAEGMRLQECDRLKALATEIKRVGGYAAESNDTLTVIPGARSDLHGAEIETYNDHRMAMCFSVLGLKVPGIRIKNPWCVSKTFPNFYDKLKQLGAELIDAKTRKPI
jgi:3-phosphoshikimate 1-carboxyvinyltransferase